MLRRLIGSTFGQTGSAHPASRCDGVKTSTKEALQLELCAADGFYVCFILLIPSKWVYVINIFYTIKLGFSGFGFLLPLLLENIKKPFIQISILLHTLYTLRYAYCNLKGSFIQKRKQPTSVVLDLAATLFTS